MPNLLAQETSPYLLQHAENPVEWRPWGKEAFTLARSENKPILLSVGYAACHWCHVMAHESFENPETAAVMNRLFVNIKVDREERPDIDSIYQGALQLLGEHGGWPLTMFLTPGGVPFWGGTYFPPEARYGRPGFVTLLQKIDEVWREKQALIEKNVAVMQGALEKISGTSAGDLFTPSIVDRVAERVVEEFDPVHGGIGTAPKFPNVPVLELLLRAYRRRGERKYAGAVRLALRQMCQGGLYDHLGGGFARYSTDALWLVPHFEKMLYDNAQLIDILLCADTTFDSPLFRARVAETADWMIRDMTAEGGAFAATLDADSEGEEGRFYVWRAEEIDACLGDAAEQFNRVYGVHPSGNWEGRTILNRLGTPELLDDAAEARLAEARQILLAHRENRIHPGRDDKILADWNGLAIAALARAGAAYGREDWLAAAKRAYMFIASHMTHEDSHGRTRLVHCYRAGRLGDMATLDDYGAMCRAALTLHQILGEPQFLDHAIGWTDVLETHYRDTDGSFFFTADDAEDLIVRTKSAHDGPTPSGNALMAGVYARLWLLTGEGRYRDAAEDLVRAFSGGLEDRAFALTALINESTLLGEAVQVIIIGARADAETIALAAGAFSVPRPDIVVQSVEPGTHLPDGHPAHGKDLVDGKPTAYVCTGPVCSPPMTNGKDLEDALRRP